VNRLERVLRRVVADLEELGCDFALVGGLAVAAQAEPRLTRDIDVAVAVEDDAAAEAVIWNLQRRAYVVQSTVEHVPTGRFGTARLLPPGGTDTGVLVDVLFASCGIEVEIVKDAEQRAVLPDLSLPVARIGHLLVMKVLAFDHRQRPQDHDDIMALLREANPDELARAEAGLELVGERGFHRGKDMRAELSRFRAESGSKSNG
jgi:hypothetical protein